MKHLRQRAPHLVDLLVGRLTAGDRLERLATSSALIGGFERVRLAFIVVRYCTDRGDTRSL
jgi:hypothetical protein